MGAGRSRGVVRCSDQLLGNDKGMKGTGDVYGKKVLMMVSVVSASRLSRRTNVLMIRHAHSISQSAELTGDLPFSLSVPHGEIAAYLNSYDCFASWPDSMRR